MTWFTCDTPDCENQYSVGEGEETDGMFVSYSVSPHDVEAVEKRAFSLCKPCSEGVENLLPQGDDR